MSAIATKQAVLSLPSLRMTVEEFEKADFYNHKRLELLDGYIVRRSEMNPPHAVITGRLRRRIDRMQPAPGSLGRTSQSRFHPSMNRFPTSRSCVVKTKITSITIRDRPTSRP